MKYQIRQQSVLSLMNLWWSAQKVEFYLLCELTNSSRSFSSFNLPMNVLNQEHKMLHKFHFGSTLQKLNESHDHALVHRLDNTRKQM